MIHWKSEGAGSVQIRVHPCPIAMENRIQETDDIESVGVANYLNRLVIPVTRHKHHRDYDRDEGDMCAC